MSFKIKPHTAADFYKIGHRPMYIEGTTSVYNNFTPRSSKLATKLSEIFDDKIVFIGLQGFIKWFLIDTWNEEFFNKPKDVVVEEYRSRVSNGLVIDNPDTSHIEALHDIGYLPISIKALPEGSLVNIKVPVFTIKETHSDFAWLPNYIESIVSSEVWKPCTSATTAYQYRKLLDQYAEKTGSPKDFVLWQGHDFAFRGLSGVHDAASSGIGHLASFLGTDTIPAMDYADDYYHGKSTFVGGSVPATEHSVASLAIGKITKDLEEGGYKGVSTANWTAEMCTNYTNTTGKILNPTTQMLAEYISAKRLMTAVFPSGVLSYVSDTFDFWSVITVIMPALKETILNRPANSIGLSKVVVRPDSGDPVKIICGDEDAGVGSAIHKGSIECLWETFGGTITETGHKLLDSHIGLIYGDSITLERANEILKRLEAKGFASGNVVFGVGSFTYQYQTRDSYGFAMKATHAVVDGVGIDIYKDPNTDNGTKKSAKGLLRVEKEGDNFVLYDQQTPEQEAQGELKEVFRNGVLLIDQTLAEIRTRLHG